MKQFLLKTASFLGLLITVLVLLKSSVPYYWGNPVVREKIEHIEQQQELYNTYFIGTSRIYRQVNPVVFDKVTQRNSFNLGFDAMFFLEAHYILEHFLTTAKNEIKEPVKVFVGEMNVHIMHEKNLHTVRNKYHMDFKRLIMAWKHHWEWKNYEQLYYHTVAFIENQLAIGEIKSILAFHFIPPIKSRKEMLAQKGFYGMDQQLALENTPELKRKRTAHLKSDRFKTMRTMDDLSLKNYRVQINKNVREYSKFKTELIDLFAIPIDLPFGPDYEFDFLHLNSEGAKIYSQKLGTTYKELSEEYR